MAKLISTLGKPITFAASYRDFFIDMRIYALGLFMFCVVGHVQAQIGLPFEHVEIAIDTNRYNLRDHGVMFRGERHLAFQYTQDEQVAEIALYPTDARFFETHKLRIVPSADFDVLDSLTYIEPGYFRFRLRFKSISKSDFHRLNFEISGRTGNENKSVALLPYFDTKATIERGEEDLYIGEEKRFEIATNNLANLILDESWQRTDHFEYRLFERNGVGYLALIPLSLGAKELNITLTTRRPFVNREGRVVYSLPENNMGFLVKGSRLAFLRTDQKRVIMSRENREGSEIQIDNNRLLEMRKTYRIEDQEEPGGPLIAELYTVRALSNDKVLCMIRPYLLHRTTEGYLYIKDGDNPRFITNVNISPEAVVEKVSILREGADWTTDRNIRPGETIDVRIEGQGLEQARFYFEDLQVIQSDSITSTDRSVTHRLRVPVTLNKKIIEIYNHDQKTGFTLGVREYERPRPLDFVTINYGEGNFVANTLNQTILYDHTVRDIVLGFDYNAIDDPDFFFGKQILEIDIRITGTRGELIEMQKIEQLEICPGPASPRAAFYQGKTCNREDIRINEYITRKTQSLDEWSRIELVIRHKKDRYGGAGYTQRVVIVLRKLVTFDVDVSFPAGLVIKRVGVDGFPGLSGISLAMLAQFSFYDKERIRRLKPYKVGAGFLAQNAFNFNPENTQRDLGIVVLGSVYPTRLDGKLTFPLFAGFGYFINEERFFYLIGPGIRISF